MIHLDSLTIPNSQKQMCLACEGTLEAGSKAVRVWASLREVSVFTLLLALMHPECAKDLGGDMVIEKGR